MKSSAFPYHLNFKFEFIQRIFDINFIFVYLRIVTNIYHFCIYSKGFTGATCSHFLHFFFYYYFILIALDNLAFWFWKIRYGLTYAPIIRFGTIILNEYLPFSDLFLFIPDIFPLHSWNFVTPDIQRIEKSYFL